MTHTKIAAAAGTETVEIYDDPGAPALTGAVRIRLMSPGVGRWADLTAEQVDELIEALTPYGTAPAKPHGVTVERDGARAVWTVTDRDGDRLRVLPGQSLGRSVDGAWLSPSSMSGVLLDPEQVTALRAALAPYAAPGKGAARLSLAEPPASVQLSAQVEAARGLLRTALDLIDGAATPRTSSAQVDAEDSRR